MTRGTPQVGLLLIGIALAAGCGSTTGSGGGASGGAGGATATDLDQLCTAQCARQARCSSADPTCESSCATDIQHPDNIRKDFIDAYTACLDSLGCDMTSDACLEQAVTAVHPNWEQDPVFTSCAARQDACQSFSDDSCAAALYFTSAARQRLEACINQACDSIRPCLEDLF